MPILDMPSSCWRTWPTAILQIMTDPGCRHPGRLADAMRRGAYPQAFDLSVERFGPSDPFIASYYNPLLREAAEGERENDYLRETEREILSGDILRGPIDLFPRIRVMRQESSP